MNRIGDNLVIGTKRCCALRRRKGTAFTAMELLMALSICSMVMLGLAAILTSVAQGWTYSENTQGYVMAESTGMLRIERFLRQCRLTGAHSVGSVDGKGQPAYLMVWVEDRQPNGLIEVGELALLEHDPVTRSVRVWEIPKQAGVHGLVISKSDLGDVDNAMLFKSIAGVQERTLAVNVSAMALWVHPPVVEEQKQLIEYAVRFDRPVRRGSGAGAQVMMYGTAAMRVLDNPEQ